PVATGMRIRYGSEIALTDVRLDPERCLQDHRLPPRIVHPVDDVGRVAGLGEERPHRDDDRRAERKQVARSDMAERMTMISLVFLGSMVAQSDLVLIVEPGLVVLGAGRIDDPLSEAFRNRTRVIGIDLVCLWILIIGAKMRMIENDSTP